MLLGFGVHLASPECFEPFQVYRAWGLVGIVAEVGRFDPPTLPQRARKDGAPISIEVEAPVFVEI